MNPHSTDLMLGTHVVFNPHANETGLFSTGGPTPSIDRVQTVTHGTHRTKQKSVSRTAMCSCGPQFPTSSWPKSRRNGHFCPVPHAHFPSGTAWGTCVPWVESSLWCDGPWYLCTVGSVGVAVCGSQIMKLNLKAATSFKRTLLAVANKFFHHPPLATTGAAHESLRTARGCLHTPQRMSPASLVR